MLASMIVKEKELTGKVAQIKEIDAIQGWWGSSEE